MPIPIALAAISLPEMVTTAIASYGIYQFSQNPPDLSDVIDMEVFDNLNLTTSVSTALYAYDYANKAIDSIMDFFGTENQEIMNKVYQEAPLSLTDAAVESYTSIVPSISELDNSKSENKKAELVTSLPNIEQSTNLLQIMKESAKSGVLSKELTNSDNELLVKALATITTTLSSLNQTMVMNSTSLVLSLSSVNKNLEGIMKSLMNIQFLLSLSNNITASKNDSVSVNVPLDGLSSSIDSLGEKINTPERVRYFEQSNVKLEFETTESSFSDLEGANTITAKPIEIQARKDATLLKEKTDINNFEIDDTTLYDGVDISSYFTMVPFSQRYTGYGVFQ